MVYKNIELFAGAGGLALGLEKAGFESLALVEIDKNCCSTLRDNRPDWNVIEDDVTKVDFTPYKGEVDLVSGGAPCQSFSYAGKRLGFGDTRGTLFHEFNRCLQETKPKMFLFENVKGLIKHDDGRTFKTISNVFSDTGYVTDFALLNASLYDVGQKRDRVFIVGIRKDLRDEIHFSFPTPNKTPKTLREALKDLPDDEEGFTYNEKFLHYYSFVPPGGCWINLPEDLQKEVLGESFIKMYGGSRGCIRRLSWDRPSPTLTTSPKQKMTGLCHPDHTRPLTVREYARIQTFPDDWSFAGGTTSKYKQIGNAVPVNLAYHIGLAIKSALNKESALGTIGNSNSYLLF